MDDMSFLILKVIISISVALITTFVIPLLKEKLDDAKYQKLLDIINVAVQAAEQAIGGPGQGAERKAEVLRFVTKYLDDNNISIKEDQLDQLIEAAVYAMNSNKKEISKSTAKKTTKKVGGENG